MFYFHFIVIIYGHWNYSLMPEIMNGDEAEVNTAFLLDAEVLECLFCEDKFV